MSVHPHLTQPPQVPPSAPAMSSPIPQPATYVPIPRRLLEDLRTSPIAIGVYALLGRLSQLTGAPVPLSAADLHAYDPALSYGAARRALARLVDSGYAIITRQKGGKGRYVPCWGPIQGQPRPWDYTLSHVGRPRHLAIYRLDDQVLDLCLGTLRPHACHAALIKRYLVTPLLSLRDVGAYALAMVAISTPDTALEGLGLLDAGGRPLPLPDPATVLAIASQRAAATGTGGLTPEGWQRVGVAPLAAPTASATPLFFVPPELIGGLIGSPAAPLIGSLIGLSDSADHAHSAAECAILEADCCPPASHRSDRIDESHPPILTGDGGGDLPSQDSAACRISTIHLPPAPTNTARVIADPVPLAADPVIATVPADEPTASERQLHALGVRRTIARSFAAYPPAQVERVIAQARARRDVRDLAGWVVSALRQVPPLVEAPPTPKVTVAKIWDHPNLTPRERAIWLQRFRSADPADQPAIIERLYREHPCEVTV